MSRLQSHFVVLSEKLDVDKIIPYLRQDRMLTNNEYEILTNPVYNTKQRRGKLLSMMYRKGKNHFVYFGNNLVWSGQTELARHIGVNVDNVPPSPYQLDPEVTCDPYSQMRQLLWDVLPGAAVGTSLPGNPPPYNPQVVKEVFPAHNSIGQPLVCPQKPITTSAPHQTPEFTRPHHTPQSHPSGILPSGISTSQSLEVQGPTSAATSERETGGSKVFILYCKDTTIGSVTGDQFCEYAFQLAEFLSQCGGIECSIDQYECDLQCNWNFWTQTKIKESRFVALILSPLLIKELLSGAHTCLYMKVGKFFSDSIANSICAPKFVPIFLNGCEPVSGDMSEWLPPGLVMSRHFRLQNFSQFINDIDPPEGNNLTPEEFSLRLSRGLAEPKNENLAEFVKFLLGRQGELRPSLPQNPVLIHSPRSSPGRHCHQHAHEYISVDDLNTIARRINGEWRQLGIKLQVDYNIIMEVSDQNPSNNQQAALEMLAMWQRMQGQAATRRVLKKALLALNKGRLAGDIFPNEQI